MKEMGTDAMIVKECFTQESDDDGYDAGAVVG